MQTTLYINTAYQEKYVYGSLKSQAVELILKETLIFYRLLTVNQILNGTPKSFFSSSIQKLRELKIVSCMWFSLA